MIVAVVVSYHLLLVCFESMARRVAACLLNVSEARNHMLVTEIAEAAVKNEESWIPDLTFKNEHQLSGQSTSLLGEENSSSHLGTGLESCSFSDTKCKGTVLNIFADVEYNRSVITLAAPIEFLGTCIFQACQKAFKEIDLSCQTGGHPRLGAVDLIPIHPLSRNLSLDECGELARKLGETIAKDIPGTSMFFFGSADTPNKRGLVERRKAMNWFGLKQRQFFESKFWDIGDKFTPQCGITGIGAIPYMTNFNVAIGTDDLEIGNSIAKAIRGSSPNGLYGVQSMAFHHDGLIEVACNVETIDLQKQDTYTGPPFATFEDIKSKICHLCGNAGIKMQDSAIIGFTPQEAYHRTIDALTKGEAFQPMRFDSKRM
eukprot:Seg2416.4 transcript_id=Seg2416.4/GoldUCD/mRNA.D3Y31 product="Glutamate formimidoyltransferase" protein_id=Seg2416.4/GoldUCD/D3Y31